MRNLPTLKMLKLGYIYNSGKNWNVYYSNRFIYYSAYKDSNKFETMKELKAYIKETLY
jgi:hypothetical protein